MIYKESILIIHTEDISSAIPCAESFSYISLFHIPNCPWLGYNYCPHFIGKKTKAYRDYLAKKNLPRAI